LFISYLSHSLKEPYRRTVSGDLRGASRPVSPLLPDGAAKVATLFESANLSVFFFFIFFPGPAGPASLKPLRSRSGCKGSEPFPFFQTRGNFFFQLPAALPAAGTLRSRLFPEAVPEGAAKVRRIFYPANLCVFFLSFFSGPCRPGVFFSPSLRKRVQR
ncbi:hypothetical protein FHS90_004508, partial [Rufibacter quisquiliarum]|nr:hypothetical protein [Rufibacter quisquiliarum]